MSSLNINVLVSAKDEYLTQMLNILIPYFRRNFKKILEESQFGVFIKYKLRPFQNELRQIQKWNDITLDEKVSELTNSYPYFYDLLKAIFIIHVKILSSIKINPGSRDLKIEIPQLKLFIHKLYIDIARKIYYEPKTILKDNDTIDLLIYNTVIETLRSQIPLQNILQEYLNDAFDEDGEEEDTPEEAEIEGSGDEITGTDDVPEVPENDEPEDESNSQNGNDVSGAPQEQQLTGLEEQLPPNIVNTEDKEIHFEPSELTGEEPRSSPPDTYENQDNVQSHISNNNNTLPTLFNDAKTL